MKAIILQSMKKFFTLAFLFILALKTVFSVSPDVVAPFSAVYDGDWENASIWDPSSVPPISGNNNNLYIYIEEDVSVTFGTPSTTDKMDFKNQFHLYLLPGATLEVFGDISIDNQFEFIVYPGANFIVHGNVKIGNQVDGVIDGQVNVSGNFSVGNNGSISGEGSLTIGGKITDDKDIIDEALLSKERYFVVSSGNWSATSSWRYTSDGVTEAQPPNRYTTAYIESGNSITIDQDAYVSHLIIETDASVDIAPGNTLTATLSITNNGTINLKSDATGTGGLIYDETLNPITATVERYLSGLKYHYVSSPLSSAPISCYNINAYGFTNTNFYSYDQSNTSSDWMDGWTVVSSGNLGVGAGYALYSTESHKHSLSGGTLNNGTIQIAVNNSANGDPSNGWNIIGNPYPCDIDAVAFINENSALIDGDALYYWDDDDSEGLNYETNDYATYNLLGGASASVNGGIPNTTIGLGQAFFIKSTGNGNINFTNAMKSETSAVFFKSLEVKEQENDISRSWFNLTNDNGDANQILIGFTSKATNAIDEGYDAEKLKGNQNIAFYSLNSNKEFAILALPPIQHSSEVLIGMDANVAGTYTIALAQTDNMDILVDIYLIDKQTGKVTDLQRESYSFEANGIITDRFAVTFIKKPPQYTRWLGNYSDKFYDQDKWDNGLPNHASTVVIPAGKKALLDGVLLCRDLIIEPGATFEFNSSKTYIDSENEIIIQSDNKFFGNLIDKGNGRIQGVLQYRLTDNMSYLSTPFQNTITGDWLSVADSTDLFLHNELQNNFMQVTDKSWNLYNGMGFAVKRQKQKPGEYSIQGTFNTGLQTIYLNSGYQLIGNPYPAYIDWGIANNTTGWQNIDQILPSIWFNKNTTEAPNSGNFAVYNRKSGIAVNGASRIIAPMQAFWIYAPNQADISVDNEVKVTPPDDVSTQQIAKSYIRLKAESDGYSDETVIGVLSESSSSFDLYDSYKMFAQDTNYPQLFTLTKTDENEVAINMMPDQLTLDTKIPLGFKSDKDGTFTIALEEFVGNNQELLVVLEDNELDNSIILSQNESYTFTSEKAKNTSRFTIGFIKETSILTNPKKKIQVYTANRTLYVLSDNRLTDYNIKIYDICGRQIFQASHITEKQMKLPSTIASGICIIQIQDNESVFNQKVFIR